MRGSKYTNERRPRLRGNKLASYERLVRDERRILVIGDLHEPFCLDDYLGFCVETYREHNCNQVIFIGDLIDSHHSSFHETDPDGLGGKDELELAIDRLQRWVDVFPVADVTIGNHDRIISRKAFSGGIPKAWIKTFNEVLGAPDWTFCDRVVYDNVQFLHGEGGTARSKARSDMQSSVQGHLHTQCYTEWYVGQNFKVFGTQIGCGIDFDRYAFNYAKRGKKPAIGCAVVIGGHTVINKLMNL